MFLPADEIRIKIRVTRSEEEFRVFSRDFERLRRSCREAVSRPNAAASIDGDAIGQLKIFRLSIVKHILRKLQFQVDASAARRSPSRPEIRFRTSTAVDGERGRLPGRGFRHRHPRPEYFKRASSNLCALDSATDFWPPIRFTANTFCIRSRRRHASSSSGVPRHQRRRPRPRLPSIPFGRLRKPPVTLGTRSAVFDAVDD